MALHALHVRFAFCCISLLFSPKQRREIKLGSLRNKDADGNNDAVEQQVKFAKTMDLHAL